MKTVDTEAQVNFWLIHSDTLGRCYRLFVFPPNSHIEIKSQMWWYLEVEALELDYKNEPSEMVLALL
jgi:hypothetical protein